MAQTCGTCKKQEKDKQYTHWYIGDNKIARLSSKIHKNLIKRVFQRFILHGNDIKIIL